VKNYLNAILTLPVHQRQQRRGPSLDVGQYLLQPKFLNELMSGVLVSTARILDQTLAFITRRVKIMHVGAVGLLLAAGLTVFLVKDMRGGETSKPGDTTASIDQAPVQLGASGFPVPRFLSLKSNKVNVRKGPSSDHAVAWVFQRKGLPVEVIAESENWRKIRDSDGSEGWILQQMLSGRRFAMAPTWDKTKNVMMRDDAAGTGSPVAQLFPGALARVESCDGTWCYLATDDYEGYVIQAELWGVYPDEVVD
jgi:SH3-like domain-containing protein